MKSALLFLASVCLLQLAPSVALEANTTGNVVTHATEPTATPIDMIIPVPVAPQPEFLGCFAVQLKYLEADQTIFQTKFAFDTAVSECNSSCRSINAPYFAVRLTEGIKEKLNTSCFCTRKSLSEFKNIPLPLEGKYGKTGKCPNNIGTGKIHLPFPTKHDIGFFRTSQ